MTQSKKFKILTCVSEIVTGLLSEKQIYLGIVNRCDKNKTNSWKNTNVHSISYYSQRVNFDRHF